MLSSSTEVDIVLIYFLNWPFAAFLTPSLFYLLFGQMFYSLVQLKKSRYWFEEEKTTHRHCRGYLRPVLNCPSEKDLYLGRRNICLVFLWYICLCLCISPCQKHNPPHPTFRETVIYCIKEVLNLPGVSSWHMDPTSSFIWVQCPPPRNTIV